MAQTELLREIDSSTIIAFNIPLLKRSGQKINKEIEDVKTLYNNWT